MLRKFYYGLAFCFLVTLVVMTYVIQHDSVNSSRLHVVRDDVQHVSKIADDGGWNSFANHYSEPFTGVVSVVVNATDATTNDNVTGGTGTTSGVGDADQTTNVILHLRRKYRPYHTMSTQNRSSWSCSMPDTSQPVISGDWQAVVPNATHVYSAFRDRRISTSTTIRIFGIMLTEEFIDSDVPRGQYYCLMWTPGRHIAVSKEANLILSGRRLGRYISTQFECRFPKGEAAFSTVSLVTRPCGVPQNAMGIVTPDKSDPDRDFTVCVSGPLKHGYNDTNQFVEWMEMNLLLGASMFYMFNYSIGEELVPYVEYYQDIGVLQLQPWTLPVEINPNQHEFRGFNLIWNFGQESATQDCLYRSMYVSKYVVFLDLDELIMPRKGMRTWKEMILAADADCPKEPPLYTLRHVFFPIEKPSDEALEKNQTIAQTLRLTTLLKVERAQHARKANNRSKYIAVPEKIKLPHVHKVYQTWNSEQKACVVSENTGLLHHYRHWPYSLETVRDVTVHKYKDEIISRTLKVHRQVKNG